MGCSAGHSSAERSEFDREIEVETAWANSCLEASPAPSTSVRLSTEEIWLIDRLFTDKESRAIIAEAEAKGFGTTSYSKSYRGNLRLITTDTSLTEAVWERMRRHVPATVELNGKRWEAIGLNECWRLSKYYPGDRFQKHCDSTFRRKNGEMSMFTVNVYLNGGFDGGTTRFYADAGKRDAPTVVPKAGRCLVFRQPPAAHLLHDGEELRSGLKYLIRSDVMYRYVESQRK